jgi:hypothetical protein
MNGGRVFWHGRFLLRESAYPQQNQPSPTLQPLHQPGFHCWIEPGEKRDDVAFLHAGATRGWLPGTAPEMEEDA